MSPIKILEDALSAGKDFGSLAGRLRDKFKSGTADLQAIYDEAEGVVDAAIAKARDGLAAFKAEVEKVEKDAEGKADADGDKKDEAPAPVVDLSAGTTTHTATDGTVTAFDQYGRGEDPKPEAVAAVVQAATDAGVAVPETEAPAPAPAQPVTI